MTKNKKTVKEYSRIAAGYFLACDRANGQCGKSPIVKPYTLAGLLYALDMTEEQFRALANTRNGKSFVSRALLKIEAFIEENALSGRLSASAAANTMKYYFDRNEKEKMCGNKNITVTLDDNVRALGE